MRGNRAARPSSSSSAPRRSWMSAGCTFLQQVALRVHQPLPLAAGDLLAAVVAARPADLGRAHRLAVDDRRRGLRVAADGPAVPLAQPGVDPLPGAGAPPLAGVGGDGLFAIAKTAPASPSAPVGRPTRSPPA